MNIWVIGSTQSGNVMSKEDAIAFGGKSANICYMRKSIEKIWQEPAEKSIERAYKNIQSGHHSVFGHVHYNLALERIPKILAMLLNNEKKYDTSEKSARYTHMRLSDEEKERYEKWIAIYTELIQKQFPSLEPERVERLALENARYLISVFTPSTIMEHTIDLRQLNYIIAWSEDYIANSNTDSFSLQLKKVLQEFLEALPDLKIEGLDARMKQTRFSLFGTRDRLEEFGETYSVNYLSSFAALAQAQRHRRGTYEMQLLETPEFFIPPILRHEEKWQKEWLQDIRDLEDRYPQGMMVKVNERGTIDDFVTYKCTERLCGAAQWEIMEQTKTTMKRYLEETKYIPELHDFLLPYSHGARCTFPGWKCQNGCIFGPKNALNRIL